MGYPGVSNRLGPADGFVPVDRTTIEVVPDARGCWHGCGFVTPSRIRFGNTMSPQTTDVDAGMTWSPSRPASSLTNNVLRANAGRRCSDIHFGGFMRPFVAVVFVVVSFGISRSAQAQTAHCGAALQKKRLSLLL